MHTNRPVELTANPINTEATCTVHKSLPNKCHFNQLAKLDWHIKLFYPTGTVFARRFFIANRSFPLCARVWQVIKRAHTSDDDCCISCIPIKWSTADLTVALSVGICSLFVFVAFVWGNQICTCRESRNLGLVRLFSCGKLDDWLYLLCKHYILRA